MEKKGKESLLRLQWAAEEKQGPSKGNKEKARVLFGELTGAELKGRWNDVLTADWGSNGAGAKSRRFYFRVCEKAKVSVMAAAVQLCVDSHACVRMIRNNFFLPFGSLLCDWLRIPETSAGTWNHAVV